MVFNWSFDRLRNRRFCDRDVFYRMSAISREAEAVYRPAVADSQLVLTCGGLSIAGRRRYLVWRQLICIMKLIASLDSQLRLVRLPAQSPIGPS